MKIIAIRLKNLTSIEGSVEIDFTVEPLSSAGIFAISGATGEEFEKLKAQAIELGAETSFSASQAAEGMENLAAAGFTTTETMEAMPGLLDLAAASGEDLASSSDIAAAALRGFGKCEPDKFICGRNRRGDEVCSASCTVSRTIF